jgi:hypothetical protein
LTVTPAARPGWLLEPIIDRSGFRIEDAVYSQDGVFAQYILRAA